MSDTERLAKPDEQEIDDAFRAAMAQWREQDDVKLRARDPRNEISWSLGMALAWIASRSPLIVANMWEKWDDHGRRDSRRLAILLAVARVSWGAPVLMSIDAATEALHDAARRGDIAVTAIRSPGGRAVIAAEDWDDIAAVWQTYDELPWKLGRIPLQGPTVAGRHPMVNSADVMRLWPMESASVADRQASDDEAERPPMDETAQVSGTSGKKPATIAGMKKTLGLAQRFMADNGFVGLTRQEGEHLLEATHHGTLRLRREAVKVVESQGKRRTPAILLNRNSELDDCRRFLMTTV